MFEKVTPEMVGVSSEHVKKYIEILEKANLSTHNVVMIRDGKIFYEAYWKPFHKDFLHRMYSVSKSFVSIAIGLLAEDGLIDLDAPMVSYIDESYIKNANKYVKKQTIRDMLMMCTGYPKEKEPFFSRKPEDRLKDYFDSSSSDGYQPRYPGSIFSYDSHGSFVLGAIVEIVTGKKLMDFLRERIFDKIGVSKEAYCLTCPGGHSWGDSAVLCKARDLAKMCQLMLRKGEWEGEQLLDKNYAEKATSNLVSTDQVGHLIPGAHGYGYQFWRTRNNSFYFNGMGSQYGICIPDKNMIFVVNSDNQGHPRPDMVIIDRFFEEIVEKAKDEPLPENKEAYDKICEMAENLELFSLKNEITQNVSDKINGREYKLEENPMGITKIKFTFENDEGKLEYTNAQGDKTIYFGIGKNVFGKFPQEGYADNVATKFAPGNYYDCAASAFWSHEDCLIMLVQIIDKYFGRLHVRFAFKENGEKIVLFMDKIAEDFLSEYEGYAEGRATI